MSYSESRSTAHRLGTLLFFVLVYLYAWLGLDPRLIHHSLGILSSYYPFTFHVDWIFFCEHLARPGALVEYAARLLTQCYAFGWAGACIITAIAWHGYWVTRVLVRLARSSIENRESAAETPLGRTLPPASGPEPDNGVRPAAAIASPFPGRDASDQPTTSTPRSRFAIIFRRDRQGRSEATRGGHVLWYLPAVLVLVMHGNYSHPLHALLALVVALTGFVAFACWAPQRGWKRLATLAISSTSLYYVAGSGSIVFPLLVAIEELVLRRRLALAGCAAICGATLPWLAVMWFASEPRDAYLGFLLDDPGILPGKWGPELALYLYFPCFFAATAIGHALVTRLTARRGRRRRDKAELPPRRRAAAMLEASPLAWTAVAIMAGGGAARLSLDTFARTVLEIDYHAQHRAWPEALTAAQKLPEGIYNVRCTRNISLALSHCGRLGDELFRYPQRPGVDLYTTPNEARDLGSLFHESRLFLELGQVNQAEKCASEALEVTGDMPAILEELALINAVKGRPESTRIFLNALAKHPFHERAARDWLARLDADPDSERDARVSDLRRKMARRDEVDLDASVEGFLLALLEADPQNRLAFEFLVGHYLVIGRPDKVASALTRLPSFSYRTVPRHFQEAVVCAAASGQTIQLPAWRPDAAVIQRAQDLHQILAKAPTREQARRVAQEAGFGDSYFFYYAFIAPQK